MIKEEDLLEVKRSINKNSSRMVNNSSLKKNRIVRNDSNPSDEMSANGHIDVNNPVTGYINGNSNNAKLPATLIK